MTHRSWTVAVVALAFALMLVLFEWSDAGDSGTKTGGNEKSADKEGGVRVEDLPKPIPDVMEGIKRAGNAVGKEISKGASAGAGAVKKALQGDKKKDKDND